MTGKAGKGLPWPGLPGDQAEVCWHSKVLEKVLVFELEGYSLQNFVGSH